jgi:hypothetical protein
MRLPLAARCRAESSLPEIEYARVRKAPVSSSTDRPYRAVSRNLRGPGTGARSADQPLTALSSIALQILTLN